MGMWDWESLPGRHSFVGLPRSPMSVDYSEQPRLTWNRIVDNVHAHDLQIVATHLSGPAGLVAGRYGGGSDAHGVVFDDETNRYHVYSGGDIQATLEAAAENSDYKAVTVHAGTYRPDSARQALIWFNQRHDGILLQAEGEVILTAANPDIANEADASSPAAVNSVSDVA